MDGSIIDALRNALNIPSVTVSLETHRWATNTRMARVWSAQTGKDCCKGPARDGIVVAIPTEETMREVDPELGDIGTDRAGRFVILSAVNEHGGLTLAIVMDTEALKRHVNHLTESIAILEGRAQ